MLEHDFIKCQEAFDPISYVPATQGRSTDVFDIAVQFERRSARFTDKLRTPLLISNLAAISFAIVHDFNLLDRSVGIEPCREGDELVFADNFVDDKPATTTYTPDLLLVAENAHADRLLNGLALIAC